MTAGLSWSLRKRLYEQASSQIDNGRTLTEILEDFRDRLSRRGRKRSAEAAHRVWRKVIDGETLMRALADNLTDLERSVLASGEKTGQLANAMRLVLDVRERTGRIRRKLQASLFAPVMYLFALYAVLFVIGYYIVPQFTAAVPVRKWTGWAYALYAMGQIAVGWQAPVILGLFVASCLLTWWALPRWTGQQAVPGRALFDKYVMAFSVYREILGFAWLLSFAALLRAGVPDTEALAGQILTSSPWQASRLRPIYGGLKNGLKMDAAMRRSGYEFPSLDLIDEIGAYVGYPDFPDKIEVVARQYAETLERQLMFKGLLISAVFSGLMFFAFFVLQLGTNAIASILASSMGSL
ncbi:type II secretion system F family protein [Trinickia fusca]|uniref:Type II secretion system protein n=1 Tax=Trinickia fusca TaxID=2419777 RepID=A0A494XG86_9BURK|nr:type II secretion system F family protein [Trinickia fusca]RKP47566.1 type II secretion system protein [Trinickia fusca]